MTEEHDLPRFSFSVELPDETTAIVAVTGDLDITSGPRLKVALLDMAQLGVRRVAVDGSGITFVDSTGLRSLTAVLRSPHKVELVIRSAPPILRNLLQVTGLDQVIALE